MPETTSHIDERHPESSSREILVKVHNGSSLRLNALNQSDGGDEAWLVTLPFQAPAILIKKNGNWTAPNTSIDPELIGAIGKAIDEQLS